MNKLNNLVQFPRKTQATKTDSRRHWPLNRSVTIKEIELVITKVPTKKSTSPYGFTDESYQTFKEELTLIFHRLFPKTE